MDPRFDYKIRKYTCKLKNASAGSNVTIYQEKLRGYHNKKNNNNMVGGHHVADNLKQQLSEQLDKITQTIDNIKSSTKINTDELERTITDLQTKINYVSKNLEESEAVIKVFKEHQKAIDNKANEIATLNPGEIKITQIPGLDKLANETNNLAQSSDFIEEILGKAPVKREQTAGYNDVMSDIPGISEILGDMD